MTETRGITCLQCQLLDLRTNPEAAKMSYGICKLDMKGVFVRFEMTRDCIPFQAADEDTVKAREAWAAKNPLPMWQR